MLQRSFLWLYLGYSKKLIWGEQVCILSKQFSNVFSRLSICDAVLIKFYVQNKHSSEVLRKSSICKYPAFLSDTKLMETFIFQVFHLHFSICNSIKVKKWVCLSIITALQHTHSFFCYKRRNDETAQEINLNSPKERSQIVMQVRCAQPLKFIIVCENQCDFNFQPDGFG